MFAITQLIPRQPVPDLAVSLLGGGTWRLSDQKPKNFTMVVVYRGLHCPICKGWVGDLNSKVPQFEGHGVRAIAISNDTAERAQQAKANWGLDKLTIGYGLTLQQGRSWGLYVSAGRGKTPNGVEEPKLFCEPGLFMIRPDRTLYFATVQTMPFARPSFGDVMKAVEYVLANNYPARGEVIELPAAAE
jgi:peroxiredoxin